MIGLQEIVAIALLASGLMFLLISAVGMLRLPDFYSRLHTSGNSETFGLMLSLLGLPLHFLILRKTLLNPMVKIWLSLI